MRLHPVVQFFVVCFMLIIVLAFVQQNKPKTLQAAVRKPVTIDQFIGLNTFIDDPIDRMKAAGIVREYHNWAWDEGDIWPGNKDKFYEGYPNNKISFNPSYAGGGGWFFDAYYKNIKEAGLKVVPCLQGSVAWLHGDNKFPFHNKPIDEKGAVTTNPDSYEKKAHHIFQFAARYGASKVNPDKLTLHPKQKKISGKNYIEYIEDWNEQDKFWEGPDAKFSPEEYAAMASADYDGHCNTMKQGTGTFGVKNADANMKLVMGGISSPDLNYLIRMKKWFEQNRRDKKFAADVINIHAYAWKNTKGPEGGGPAVSPEDYGFKERLAAFTAYRNKYIPHAEVWITEFGWDTNPNSPLAAPAIGSMTTEEVQGIWMVRAYLAFAAAGVDRAFMYMLRDIDAKSKTQFASSGLTTAKPEFKPKPSWFYVYTLKNTLKNMVFAGEEKSGNNNLLIYKFKDVQQRKTVYAVWFKTSIDYRYNNYALQLPANAKQASIVELKNDNINGEKSLLPISNNKVHFTVSEKPAFIIVD